LFEQLKERMAFLYGVESSVFRLFANLCDRMEETPWNLMMLESLVSEHESGFSSLVESEAV